MFADFYRTALTSKTDEPDTDEEIRVKKKVADLRLHMEKVEKTKNEMAIEAFKQGYMRNFPEFTSVIRAYETLVAKTVGIEKIEFAYGHNFRKGPRFCLKISFLDDQINYGIVTGSCPTANAKPAELFKEACLDMRSKIFKRMKHEITAEDFSNDDIFDVMEMRKDAEMENIGENESDDESEKSSFKPDEGLTPEDPDSSTRKLTMSEMYEMTRGGVKGEIKKQVPKEIEKRQLTFGEVTNLEKKEMSLNPEFYDWSSPDLLEEEQIVKKGRKKLSDCVKQAKNNKVTQSMINLHRNHSNFPPIIEENDSGQVLAQPEKEPKKIWPTVGKKQAEVVVQEKQLQEQKKQPEQESVMHEIEQKQLPKKKDSAQKTMPDIATPALSDDLNAINTSTSDDIYTLHTHLIYQGSDLVEEEFVLRQSMKKFIMREYEKRKKWRISCFSQAVSNIIMQEGITLSEQEQATFARAAEGLWVKFVSNSERT
jgi:hypothetical protein